MSLYPGATVRLLPEAGQQPTIRATQVILHVAVSEADSLYGYWTSPGVGLESHLYVPYEKRPEQYVDSGRSADANLTANRRPDGTGALSVETAGLGGGQWTDHQLDEIVAFIRWAHSEHGIPLRLCRTPDDPGIGWHVMWGAPGPWTPAVGKVCPGPARIEQIKTVIMPRLLAGPTLGDPMTDEQMADLKAFLRALTGAGGGKTVTGVTETAYNQLHADLTAVQANLTAVKAELDEVKQLVATPAAG